MSIRGVCVQIVTQRGKEREKENIVIEAKTKRIYSHTE